MLIWNLGASSWANEVANECGNASKGRKGISRRGEREREVEKKGRDNMGKEIEERERERERERKGGKKEGDGC